VRANQKAPEPSTPATQAGTSLIRDLAAIVGAQLIGEMVQRTTGIAIPGPVLGLVIFLIFLILRGGPWGTLSTSARGLLQYLSLLFVPAGAGVAAHFELIRAEWMPIVASVLGSSIVAILVTAWTMRAVERWQEKRRAGEPRARFVPSEGERRI
jgi:holin-like protein